MKVKDYANGTTTEYESIDAFKEWAKREFDESVWGIIDELCEHYASGEPCEAEEALLAVEIL